MQKRYYLKTYGCQMNEYDSEVIAAILNQKGYLACDEPEKADLIVFNTCCVRENAEQKVYGRLGEFKELKRKKDSLIIAVLGCMAEKGKEKLVDRFSHVNLVLGPRNMGDLKESIEKLEENKSHYLVKVGGSGNGGVDVAADRKNKATAELPISTGCNCFCSFCVVPYVRGKLKSYLPEKILSQAEDLAKTGYKEIIFLGQNVNAYGKDLPGKVAFIDILSAANNIEGIERIRYTSPHPKDFDEEFVEQLSKLSKVCPHIHLPLQSGDDEILKKMGRGYTSSKYVSLIKKLREKIPGISITTDIIVGFPGETEEQFKNTLKLVKKIRFDSAFMFAYSPRKDTRAFELPETLTKEEKLERLHELIAVQNEISYDINKACVGIEVDVLPEDVSWKNSNRLTGHTANYKNVVFDGAADMIGKIVKLEIVEAYTWGFYGKRRS